MSAQHPHFTSAYAAYLASVLIPFQFISASKIYYSPLTYLPALPYLELYFCVQSMVTTLPHHFIDQFPAFSLQKCSQNINLVTYNFTNIMMNSRLSASTKLQITEENGLDPLQINQLRYEHQLLIPMKISQKQPIASYPIIFKVMKCRNQQRLVIYLLSQADLFFLYKIQLDMSSIELLNTTYHTKILKLDHFIEMFALFLNEIETGQKNCMLVIMDEHTIALSITRMYGNKKFQVLQLEARKQDQEVIKSMVAFKYGSKRQTIMKKQEKIAQLREMVRLKNPYLLTYFNKI